MGRIDDKKGIFNEIGALTSVKDNFNLPNTTNSLSSVNNSKEAVPFLLDMLTVLVGSQALEGAVGELMTGLVRNVEPQLKTELKKQTIEFNSDQMLPAGFNAGYTVPAKDVDSYGKLKTDPNSQIGSLTYNDNQDDFDVKSYDAILNPNSDVAFDEVTVSYNDSTDEFTYKPTNSNQTIGNFTNSYIDGITLINEKEYVSNVTNVLFGTVTSGQNKTDDQAIFEEKYNKTIQKVIDEDESLEITDEELRLIELTAKNRVLGIQTLDVGCGTLISNVSIDDLENLISTTTGSTDPTFVGAQYTSTLTNSFSDVQSDQAQEDDQTIKDGFFKRLINAIVFGLVSAIIAPPQIRALLAITSGFKNNDNPSIGDPIDDVANKRQLINCLSDTAKSTVNEFLFDLVKRELFKLIVPVTKIILKEKINQFINILKSLTGFKI